MAIGPLHYLMITFAAGGFTGDVMSELRAVRSSGLIRLIDLLFITKSGEGVAASVEMSDLRGTEIEELAAMVGELVPTETGGDLYVRITRDGVVSGFTEEDVQGLSGTIPNGTSAAVVVFEHTWARGLAEALHRAGGTISEEAILDGGRVRGG
jgi:Family of unknown function (DUF6325)